MIVTEVGELVPAYTENGHRKNKPSVEFNRQGMIVSVALEEQQEVLTPIGELPAELVKFYGTGELHWVFVVDGQISGFWSEEEERERNIPLSFDLGFASFTALLNGLNFYRDGAIQSITLYPGETIQVETPLGEVETKVGLSLYESGALKSVEPAETILVITPIGQIAAFDTQQQGINADSNSLEFTEEGQIKALVTCDHAIYVQTGEGLMEKFTPKIVPHPLEDDSIFIQGLKIAFDYEADEVILEERHFSRKDCGFTLEPFVNPMQHCSPADCASCSLCSK